MRICPVHEFISARVCPICGPSTVEQPKEREWALEVLEEIRIAHSFQLSPEQNEEFRKALEVLGAP